MVIVATETVQGPVAAVPSFCWFMCQNGGKKGLMKLLIVKGEGAGLHDLQLKANV